MDQVQDDKLKKLYERYGELSIKLEILHAEYAKVKEDIIRELRNKK